MQALGRSGHNLGAFTSSSSILYATSTNTNAHTHRYRTDVLRLLRNYVNLAQNSMTFRAPTTAAAAKATATAPREREHTKTFTVQTTRRVIHGFAGRSYSRYSASTIMTSYCKELSLKDYDIIGFDLDGTLLRYNLTNMSALIYDVLKRYLVDNKGYSEQLLKLPMDLDFLQKGLFLDGPRGNILKLSSEAQILRATHGTRLLTDEEIVAIYGPERQWAITTSFYKDPLSTWNGAASEQMRSLLDYFDTPSALVFAQAVDLVDKESESPPQEYEVWRDLQAGLMHIFSRDHFSNDISLYFKGMRADPQKYVLCTDSSVMDWLSALRKSGKKLFLLTGSNIDFANLTATQALGKDWQEYFDFVVTYAKKPGFFTIQRPFLQVDVRELKELANTELPQDAGILKPGELYSQGNWHQLHKALARLLNKEPAKARALYFGDNIIQDVYTPVRHRDFDAVAIAEELLMEEKNYPYFAELDSQLWGSYFAIGCQPTLWSNFISSFAQICVPSMQEVAQTAPAQRIVCTNPYGFSPRLPKELEMTHPTSCWEGGTGSGI
ncbi:5'-nucleotidase domain-containing protein 1 [Drosophila pseudoobscura]|uniref:5'-nucleotidase domain-containing protein 1 n=1 Tax=Drosophila pseudoobscura pseudoobscura TaxID=46245 RepID=A0A6I8UAN9_DROPS|nr:5'-nucleotidase domain-containing protein 1 [Drosophila pseudoobscura]